MRYQIRAIKNIVQSPERIKEIGKTGRDFVERHLTMESSVSSLLAIYKNLINKNRKLE